MDRRTFPSKDQLRLAKIGTSAQIAALGPDKLFIADHGGSRFQVEYLHGKTDPQDWLHDGHKTFLVAGRSKGNTAREAMGWADAFCGKRVWVSDPFGGFQDARCVALAWRAVTAAEGRAKAKTIVICG